MSTPLTLLYRGKKAIVKLSPSDHVGKALEEACSQWKISPDNLVMKHLRRTIDPSIQLRFAAIPSHTRLDVFDKLPSPSTPSQPVVSVAIAPYNQEPRVFGSFPKSTPLSVILDKLNVPLTRDTGAISIKKGSTIVPFSALSCTSLEQIGAEVGSVLLEIFWGDILEPTPSPPTPQTKPEPTNEAIPPLQVPLSASVSSHREVSKPQPKMVGTEVPLDPMAYTRIFSPSARSFNAPEPPEKFFDVTPIDALSYHASARKDVEYLTSVVSKKVKLVIYYRSTTVKVLFPNGYVAQTILPSCASFSSVLEWLKSIMSSEVGVVPFDLLGGVPPKPLTCSTQSLHDLGLSPSCLLRLLFREQVDKEVCPFKDELKSRLITEPVPIAPIEYSSVPAVKPVSTVVPKWLKR
ncbi:hypothetical protein RCL1_009050 [Eukaryota sp. TZLM3-RCL]